MGQASREWRSIVERELRTAFREFQAGTESVDLPPESYNLFFFAREIKMCRDLHASTKRLMLDRQMKLTIMWWKRHD